DWNMGTLYKRKTETGNLAKVAGLPSRCIVDNENYIHLAQIDKAWYIAEAKRHINEFLYGKDRIKKSAKKVNSIVKSLLKLL
ncbi:MAG: DNA polymerase elongation subunit (family B), partial [Clostridia bacterium]|nr:DNA polymerase elongation subunit (family B) [Clostridia bacterium]